MVAEPLKNTFEPERQADKAEAAAHFAPALVNPVDAGVAAMRGNLAQSMKTAQRFVNEHFGSLMHCKVKVVLHQKWLTLALAAHK